MRKVLFIAVLILVCGCFAVAQDSPKAELGAGWDYLHLDRSGGSDESVPAGFNVDGTAYLTGFLGFALDFQYHHKGLPDVEPGGRATAFSFHGGPRVKAHMGRFEPFAHALIGFTHLTFHDPSLMVCRKADCVDAAFSTKIGGGLDVGISRHVAVRLGEFNYYLTKFNDTDASTSELHILDCSPGLDITVGGCILNGQGHQHNFTFSTGIVIR